MENQKILVKWGIILLVGALRGCKLINKYITCPIEQIREICSKTKIFNKNGKGLLLSVEEISSGDYLWPALAKEADGTTAMNRIEINLAALAMERVKLLSL